VSGSVTGVRPFGRAASRLALGACLLLACSAHPRAGTGDIAFRLLWEGLSDLDVFVQDPAGGCISFAGRESPSGGILDVDCNAGTGRVCRHPIENVYWPPGAAPAGDYVFWVHAHSLIPAESPLAFELQLYLGTEVAWRHEGLMLDHDEVRGPFVYRYPAPTGATPVASGEPAPRCDAPWPGPPRP
jgi:hypothetical protein